jgi:DNA invertase Pin-like site-specific DNA recombinase
MASDKIRYFLYARKSSESEEKQVASIDSQITELERLAKQYGLTVVRVFSESKSAKAPNNRPVFGEMMERLYKGEAEGILCWKLDRLARNPVDGGTINWILQNGIVKHIRTFDREYLPTDNVLMMSVEFGMANQFIRDLSSNTKRGLNSKAEKGVFPSRAPIGYLNDKYHPKGEKKIIPDPERFPIIRKLWDELLEQECTIDRLHTLAIEKYNLTGFYGRPVHRNVIYDIFTNPFYFGMFNWNKKVWQGTHEPMISKEEFECTNQFWYWFYFSM